ncbi:putative DNA primase/helicase [Dysgonomonas sp. PH5-45]|uniref:virulence-associated E family protein n=1 Tax=unclassified Dysgonomonas TaxID=2630389 RepID=UPI0024770B86|nr:MULTISPECIES: virulence-associated E family protein [unclassified Dysgonomonas]MDH6354700.1 putative DNA primase/helicase [Dysgonomonas sp. PH5-45]MDH6387598.1 putative DNA primase/helicase [Dysgonomonas sp. PH5-37]
MSDKLQIKYDGELDIAIGRSRKEVNWKNKTVDWSAFLNRIKDTHRTHETFSQYLGMNKTMQSDIKDIGGFVGGFIAGGRRKIENVSHRQLVTLDIDFGTMDIWADFKLMGFAGAIYSTHKHSPDKPRLRLIVPLDREVSREEYEPIARYIANEYDINAFDDTTFDVCRLMYWPSSPKDGDYIFEYSDGEWMSADDILNSYTDWTDASSWPISERVDKAVHSEIKKQEIPTEKKGIVGAFCRTYSISEAIDKFLAEEYEACDVENRFTYKHGSTAAGLVVYDDLFAFSHHGTDPASGKLCNAFDLVRVHKFGIKDTDSKENTPANKLPSYIAMQEFATKDGEVRKTIAEERLESAKEDFEDFTEEDVVEVEDDTWLEKLDVDSKGVTKASITNCRLIFENHKAFKGKFAYNEFRNTNDVMGNLPWRRVDKSMNIWNNFDNGHLSEWFERNFDISHESKLKIAKLNTFDMHRYHPVRDYLNSLKWDGVKRVETVFIDNLGAADTPYTRAVTLKSLVAAVARIFEPGVKFDYVSVLVGEQGVGKSVTLQKLGKSDKGWFSDNFDLKGTNQDVEQVLGVWIKEIQELAGFRGKDAEKVKSFISSRQDECRLAFKEEKGYFPRQCVFFGTSNDYNFLNDPSGNRRFWPIRTYVQEPTKDFRRLEDEVDQIWAEAVQIYKNGESLFLDKNTEAMARRMQDDYRSIDEWEELIREYLDIEWPENWKEMDLGSRKLFLNGDELAPKGEVKRDKFSVLDIWCERFNGDIKIASSDAKRIRNAMRKIEGWEEKVIKVEGKSVRGFYRIK